MKRVICAFAAMLTMLSSMFLFCMTASANYAKGWAGHPEDSQLIDNTGIFDDRTVAELNKRVRQYSEELELNIVIYMSNTYMSDSSTEIFADDTYDEMFGEDTDGVFYYMDFSGKSPAYDYISTSGKAVLFYQNHIESIFNSMDAFLPSSGSDYTKYADEISGGVSYFLDRLAYYDQSNVAKKGTLRYYKDVSSGKFFYYKHGELIIDKKAPPLLKIKVMLVALAVGAVTALIVFCVGKSSYKFKSSTNASVYISNEETKKGTWEDNFIRTYTTKTRIESSSGGGSRGGGGGHSHSGGHGGGGHHR